jgi:hypothetical protein
MQVYVLTNEPYHDNSWQMGVYGDLGSAVGALIENVRDLIGHDVGTRFEQDYTIQEWDTETQANRNWDYHFDSQENNFWDGHMGFERFEFDHPKVKAYRSNPQES